MFIGHFGVAMAAKKAAPKVSLGTLLLATSFLDLLWPVFLLLGIEHVRITPGDTAFTPLEFVDYPYSHSLVMAIVWGMLFAVVCYLQRRLWKNGLLLGGVVVSHWVLDWASHRADMPLIPGGERYGLGLWNSVPATIAVESLMFLFGIVIYLKATRAKDRIGTWSFWVMIVTIAIFYVSNILGPPPLNERFLAWFTNGLWIFPIWGWWIERHRIPA